MAQKINLGPPHFFETSIVFLKPQLCMQYGTTFLLEICDTFQKPYRFPIIFGFFYVTLFFAESISIELGGDTHGAFGSYVLSFPLPLKFFLPDSYGRSSYPEIRAIHFHFISVNVTSLNHKKRFMIINL